MGLINWGNALRALLGFPFGPPVDDSEKERMAGILRSTEHELRANPTVIMRPDELPVRPQAGDAVPDRDGNG